MKICPTPERHPVPRTPNTLLKRWFVLGLTALTSFLVVGLLLACAQTKSTSPAGRPRRVGAQRGKSIVVKAGGNLQAAIDAAQFGDTIILQAGATYRTGGAPYYSPFNLGPKSGGTGTDADFITIQSSNIGSLPAGRVSPQDKANMAKIEVLGTHGAFVFLANARYWKLAGLEITNVSDGTQVRHVNTFISIGGYAGVAHSWIDRCYVHPQEDGTNAYARTASHGIVVGSPLTGANVYDTRITNSRISGFAGAYAHDPKQLIDAIALTTSVLDTILVDNNFLSGTYQPWFPGGADPVNPKTAVVQGSPAPTLTTATLSNVTGLSVGDYMTFPQSDANPRKNGNARITAILGNNITFTSMARFRGAPEPPVAGSTVMWGGDVGRNYTVRHNTFDIDTVLTQAALKATGSSPKGYIEMKMGLNVLIEGNIFQGWPSTIAIQSTNQNSDTPWVTVSDYTFRNNWVRDFGYAFVISMGNPGGPDWDLNRLGENLVIENNLFTQDTVAPIESKIMTAINLGPNASIQHNTWVTRADYDGQAVSIVPGGGGTGLTVKDNIWLNSRYGWGCNGGLPACFPNRNEAKNVIINNLRIVADGEIQALWPKSYVASSRNNPVVFTGSDPNVLLDWKLAAGSPYRAGGARQASDGTDVGVNLVTLAAALAGGNQPTASTPPTASPP